MGWIEHPLREILVRYTLAQQPSDELFCHARRTHPDTGLQAGVLVGELGPKPRFAYRWLVVGHVPMSPGLVRWSESLASD
jgi:hypothetical protein